MLAFDTTDLTWHGGVDAIFEEAKNGGDAILFQYDEGGHMSLGAIDSSQLEEMGEDSYRSGLGNIFGLSLLDMVLGTGGKESRQFSVVESVRYYATNFLHANLNIPKSQTVISIDQLLNEAIADPHITVKVS